MVAVAPSTTTGRRFTSEFLISSRASSRTYFIRMLEKAFCHFRSRDNGQSLAAPEPVDLEVAPVQSEHLPYGIPLGNTH